jgi:hypothetical protein
MSTDDDDENGAAVRRAREVASYLRGKAPPPPELACAPRLQGWRAVIARTRSDDGRLRLLMLLVGRVTGHPQIADGRTIHTSEVIWLDRNRNWARSWNRLYRLGASADDGTDPGESEESAA